MMSRQRRSTYLTLLALGAAALAADRWMLPGGAAGAADNAPGESAPRPATPGLPATEAQSAMFIPEMPFPKNIPPSELGESIRDLFAPPLRPSDKSPGDRSGDKQASDNPENAKEESADSDTFMSRHHLNGVLINESLRIAIVDGTWMRVGQAVSGCTLVTVTGNAATFGCSDGEAVLTVGDRPEAGRD